MSNTNKLITFGYKDDEVILNGIRKGRSQAFRALYDQNADRVFRLAMQLVKDEALAQNVVQDTFIVVFNKIHGFRAESKISTWIYKIAYNHCLNEIKKRKRQQSKIRELGEMEFEKSGSDGTLGKLYQKEQVSLILKLVDDMSEKKKSTFTLHYIEERTADEIAGILDEGRGTVLKRLNRIRLELMEKIGKLPVKTTRNKVGQS